MKFWLAIFIIGIIVTVLFYPPVNKERICYESAQSSMNDIAASVISRGLSQEEQCGKTTDALWTLESCMQEATKSSMVANYANGTIQQLVSIIRPYAKSLWTQKVEHNQECVNSSYYQIP